jgi:hypothetical protein
VWALFNGFVYFFFGGFEIFIMLRFDALLFIELWDMPADDIGNFDIEY